jgi:hypothetical protein
MPFKSKAQRRWMYANDPDMAERWSKETPKGKKLPEKVKKQLGGVRSSNDPRLRGYDPGEEIGEYSTTNTDSSAWMNSTDLGHFKGDPRLTSSYEWFRGQHPTTPGEDVYRMNKAQIDANNGQLSNVNDVAGRNQEAITNKPKTLNNQKVDPFFLLRGATNGLSWLGGIKDRARQNQYMQQQYSTLGQITPSNTEDYQPAYNNQYFQKGGPRLVSQVPTGYQPIPTMPNYFKKDTQSSKAPTGGPQMSDADWRRFVAKRPQQSQSSDTVFIQHPSPAAPQQQQHPISSFDGELIYGMDNKPAGMYRFNTRSGMHPESGITNSTGNWADAQWMNVNQMGQPIGEMATIPGQDFFNRVIEGGNRLHNRAPIDSSFRALTMAKKEMGGMKKGGIHIKEENKGKFTEYKKRTGKTTEEALHSDDPRIRKMANFAKNAKKWKHQYGGTTNILRGE